MNKNDYNSYYDKKRRTRGETMPPALRERRDKMGDKKKRVLFVPDPGLDKREAAIASAIAMAENDEVVIPDWTHDGIEYRKLVTPRGTGISLELFAEELASSSDNSRTCNQNGLSVVSKLRLNSPAIAEALAATKMVDADAQIDTSQPGTPDGDLLVAAQFRCRELYGERYSSDPLSLELGSRYRLTSNLHGQKVYQSTSIMLSRDVKFSLCTEGPSVSVEVTGGREWQSFTLNTFACSVVSSDCPKAETVGKAFGWAKSDMRSGEGDSTERTMDALSRSLKSAQAGHNIVTRLVKGFLYYVEACVKGELILGPMTASTHLVNTSFTSVGRAAVQRGSCYVSLPEPDRGDMNLLLLTLAYPYHRRQEAKGTALAGIEIPGEEINVYGLGLGMTPVASDTGYCFSPEQVLSYLVSYARHMQCSSQLERAYAMASLLLCRRNRVSYTLPCVNSVGDLTRTAWVSDLSVEQYFINYEVEGMMMMSVMWDSQMALILKDLRASQCSAARNRGYDDLISMMYARASDRSAILHWYNTHWFAGSGNVLQAMDVLKHLDDERLKACDKIKVLDHYWVATPKGTHRDSIINTLLSGHISEAGGGVVGMAAYVNATKLNVGILDGRLASNMTSRNKGLSPNGGEILTNTTPGDVYLASSGLTWGDVAWGDEANSSNWHEGESNDDNEEGFYDSAEGESDSEFSDGEPDNDSSDGEDSVSLPVLQSEVDQLALDSVEQSITIPPTSRAGDATDREEAVETDNTEKGLKIALRRSPRLNPPTKPRAKKSRSRPTSPLKQAKFRANTEAMVAASERVKDDSAKGKPLLLYERSTISANFTEADLKRVKQIWSWAQHHKTDSWYTTHYHHYFRRDGGEVFRYPAESDAIELLTILSHAPTSLRDKILSPRGKLVATNYTGFKKLLLGREAPKTFVNYDQAKKVARYLGLSVSNTSQGEESSEVGQLMVSVLRSKSYQSWLTTDIMKKYDRGGGGGTTVRSAGAKDPETNDSDSNYEGPT
jgi:hypothetical protein